MGCAFGTGLTFGHEKTEAKIGIHSINKMTGLGHAKFEVVA
jgi:hypothetical protein